MAASLFSPVLPSSVLALGTTAHLALSALRHHRRPGPGAFSALTLISLGLSLTPWVFPGAIGLALGLALHGLWFAACERLAPAGATRGATPPPRPADPPAKRRSPPLRTPLEDRTSAPARPAGFIQVPVLATFEETPDIRTFRMARPDHVDFAAGQFLPVRVRIDRRDHVRCYSISSSPSARGYLEISVKRIGLVSGALHAIAQPGALLFVRAPAGSFTYPAGDDRPLLLLAGGIGITPLLSMLRHAVEVEPWRRVTLLYSAATEEGLAFRDDIRALVRRHPQARVHFAVTRGGGGPDLYAGRIDDTLVRAALPDVRQAIAMICGPTPMIGAMRELLSAQGVPAGQIRSELFEAAVAASTGHQPDSAREHAPVTPAHTVKCARTRTDVRASAGQSLLEAAEAGGVAIDSLCRSGVCGTCRTRVLDGDVACESTVLADEDRRGGYVLACVAHVQSDCSIDA